MPNYRPNRKTPKKLRLWMKRTLNKNLMKRILQSTTSFITSTELQRKKTKLIKDETLTRRAVIKPQTWKKAFPSAVSWAAILYQFKSLVRAMASQIPSLNWATLGDLSLKSLIKFIKWTQNKRPKSLMSWWKREVRPSSSLRGSTPVSSKELAKERATMTPRWRSAAARWSSSERCFSKLSPNLGLLTLMFTIHQVQPPLKRPQKY